MLAIGRPMRSGAAWCATLDCHAGGQWVRVRLRARDGTPAAASDAAFGSAALDAARALLVALGRLDTSIADAAELAARLREGDDDAAELADRIASDAASSREANQAAAYLLEAADAYELLSSASAGDDDALEALARMAIDASAGNPAAQRAEAAIGAPALFGAPTLDLGTMELGGDPSRAVLRRLASALLPALPHDRTATATIRAIGSRGGE